MMVGATVEAPVVDPISAAVTRVRLLARRRVRWLATIGPQESEDSVASAELCRALLDLDDPSAEQRFYEQDPQARSLGQQARCMAELALDRSGVLGDLVASLALDEAEADLLQVCVALEIDPSLGAVYAFLAGDPEQRWVTEPLAARLCGYGRRSLWSPVGGLAQWEVLVAGPAAAGESPPLRVDPFMLGFLRNRVELDASLLRCATRVDPRPPLRQWPVGALAGRVRAALERGAPSRIVLEGPRSSGRRTLAACIGAQLGMSVLTIDTDAVPEAELARIHRRGHRQALLHRMALLWHGSRVAHVRGDGLARLPLEIFVIDSGADITAGRGWHEQRFRMPPLSSEDRLALWSTLVPAFASWDELHKRHVSERYCLQVGEIEYAAAQGVSEPREAEQVAREVTRGRLGELGTLLECPFVRRDLHLPDRLERQLDELLFEARERVRFWENEVARRMFPRGTGLVALLSGAPGTGKTMTAQVLARELGLDLFRIDLASTVSKYIGETAKNLRRLFVRAAEMNAVLLFDEADALFSKRTDVRDSHDRHANADTNYLLQLVEDYPGIAILATNRRQNMDDAFVRRVRYLLYFPRPEAAQRRSIWAQLVGSLGGPDAVEAIGADLDALADATEATGAQIKNAVLAAAFFSREERRPIQMAHLMRGLERELGNQGRTLPPGFSTRERSA
ncbi:ATP-binding protein [Paraliomyxa miuraensis]|uniref:ATP-binding protein n=1 Tax=Paraliomyxa miuraensis TaxID=376150 RepID=UPI00224D51F9|nr:ATP-binding protein [Paraliomyxa miuraensis]MCX4245549.1 ATP-binding protein [Paraliomyxa miuraensis]